MVLYSSIGLIGTFNKARKPCQKRADGSRASATITWFFLDWNSLDFDSNKTPYKLALTR